MTTTEFPPVTIIGAGLAGCEAAWQLAQRKVQVTLIDMKPEKMSLAHHSQALAELVCSNSLKANQVDSASGLLKAELRLLNSLVIQCADETSVPAGGALAVDRELFSQLVTEKIKNHPFITFQTEEIKNLPREGYVICATGPLTQGGLFLDIQKIVGEDTLHFFDAAAPIVVSDSIDYDIAFPMSRYDKGGKDYLNCPMNQEEYEIFWQALTTAELAEVKDFDREIIFQGCMPIESMAKKGLDTIRFGPLKPVGLIDPRTGKEPYACVQLRQDNRQASMYNLVGFQTRLKFPEQKRVFRLIPGLNQAEFFRMGVMHRNTYIHSPGKLNASYNFIPQPRLYFAGQITGVEGYVESISSGLVAGISLWKKLRDNHHLPFEVNLFSEETMIGALSHYISDPEIKNFSPMNANFGIIPHLGYKIRGKKERYQAYAKRSLESIESLLQYLEKIQ